MMKYKITDQEYQLSEIEALQFSKVFNTGSTEPILIHGVDQNGNRGQYVVKCIKATRMSPSASNFELLGTWIGRELGFNTVEPVLVNISHEFVQTFAGQPGYTNALKSIGKNYGCVYEPAYMEVVTGAAFSKELTTQLLQIYAFDMFISNADRRITKPNLLTDGENILLLDHELAFSFVNLLFAKNSTPWKLNHSDFEMAKGHYLYPYLKGAEHDFTEFVERFLVLNDEFWANVHKFIPKEWQSDQIEQIRVYLKSITDNRQIFSDQLTQTLL